jgi:hypothetical protein
MHCSGKKLQSLIARRREEKESHDVQDLRENKLEALCKYSNLKTVTASNRFVSFRFVSIMGRCGGTSKVRRLVIEMVIG